MFAAMADVSLVLLPVTTTARNASTLITLITTELAFRTVTKDILLINGIIGLM